jgi:phospholipid/cholesterol/gamma-HCH transport system substrate-binding protein
MLKYRGSQLIRAGFFGLALIVLLIAVGLRPQQIVAWMTSVRYQAEFADAGGLAVGNDVTRAGIKVGSVSEISLDRGKALVTFTVEARHPLGSQTTAHIRTGTLLGQRVLTVQSSGDGTMNPGDLIPIPRTSSPYSLTDAVSDLTTNTAGTDTATLNQSLDTLSATLDQIAPQLGPTFDGVTKLSKALNARDETLGKLLESTADVTGILAQRSDGVNALLLNANELISVLNDRRESIVALLDGVAQVSAQLTNLARDNKERLGPTLDRMNAVAALLEKNRDNIAKAIPGLAKYQLTQAEALSNGYYYNALIPNLIPGQFLQPFLDYAFGFRRGVNAGQPPDNAGPRAELPFPFNGIPGGSR